MSPKNRKRPRIWHRGWLAGRAQARDLAKLPRTPEAEQVETWGEPTPLMREHPERVAKKARPKP